MESKKLFYFKVFASSVASLLVLAAFIYVCIKGDLEHNILSFSCIGACLILSLLFIRKMPKKIIFTIALAFNVVADYFLVLMPSEDNLLIGLCIMAVVQAAYLLFTLFLIQSIGYRVISLALRVGICLLAYFLFPIYFELTTIQLIYAMIVLNSFVTLLTFLCFIKTQWLSFLGFLLFFAFDFFTALGLGWGILLQFPVEFLAFIAVPFSSCPPIAFLCYIPGVLLLALSSVWDSGLKSKNQFLSKFPTKPFVSYRPINTQNTEFSAINRPTQTEGISRVSLDDL